MIQVELGIKLNNPLSYYESLLTSHGLKRVFKAITHDLYYTNKDLNGMTENEMKTSCIRLRSVNGGNFEVQNNNLNDIRTVTKEDLSKFEEILFKWGYQKVFDTIKEDYQYSSLNMKSRIQLQQIKDIGLLVYYDNKDYYSMPFEDQRRRLINDLNTLGFNFDYDIQGLDKLRTLYYKKEMYSNNQNN